MSPPESLPKSAHQDALTLTFRCPVELEGHLTPPIAAARGLPDWFKVMPPLASSELMSGETETVKRCPPFIDAMSRGFLICLWCDLVVDRGALRWDHDLPVGRQVSYPRAPIGFHDPSQMSGAPLIDPDRFLIKFHNLWTIEAPEGYTVLFTHPVNRLDLPFTTLTGIVDCDRYHDSWVHFPAYWHDLDFQGVLTKGTPIAQCVPLKRESWEVRIQAFSDEEAGRVRDLTSEIGREKGVYRRRFRV
jgi:hypothetical protein